MEQLHVTGINEDLAGLITIAAQPKLTPASIIKEIIQGNNIVSEYLSKLVDIKKLAYDLEEEHISLLEQIPSIEDQTIKVINNMKTADRYTTTLRFIYESTSNDIFQPVLKKTLGKYIRFEHFKEDIKNLLPITPNRVYEEVTETILDTFGRDLTALYLEGELPTVIGRDEEVQRMIQILTRQTKANPILLGKAGVGKTALLEKLAGVIVDGHVPQALIGFKIIELNMAKLLSADGVESIILEIVETAHKEKAILFIDEVHLINNDKGKIANLLKPAMARDKLKLVGATTHDEYKTFEKDEAIQRRFQPITVEEPSSAEVYEILKTKAQEAEEFHNVLIPRESLLKAITLSDRYIQNRQQPDKAIDLIEEAASRLRATLESKPQVIVELQRELGDIFIQREIIEVQSGDRITERNQGRIDNITLKITEKEKELALLSAKFKDQNQLLLDVIRFKKTLLNLNKARDKALHLSNFEVAVEYDTTDIPEMENKIIDIERKLIDMASTVDENLIQNVVVPVMIERVIETITGIPASAQNEEDIQKYAIIEETLKREVHGQDESINLMSKAIKRSKAGLADQHKPLGSFLCLGPTGVGKTYLAQKLTEFMFDTDKVLKRFDMSEYMEAHAVSRLFGSPPGYIGHDEGGQLTEAIRRNPYSVILFDEIEKAHPKVFNALLQVLDAGRMTDGKGNEVNFKNTVIIITSNIGSEIIRSGLERDLDKEVVEHALLNELTKHFKPEFLNRFDAKLVFNSLNRQVVEKIAESELKTLANRLEENNNLTLYWHSISARKITEASYDIMNGARPIKRFINDNIVSLLTDRIMQGEIKANENSLVYLAWDEEVQDFDVFSVTKETLKLLQAADDSDVALEKTKPKKKAKKKKEREKEKEIDVIIVPKEDKLDTELGD